MEFKRSVSTAGVLFASISAMVGSGWLFSPLYAAQMAGPAALLSWLIAGIFTLIVALTFAELGTLFPIAGGVANYPYFTHGKFVGFLLGWISWMTMVVISPIEVQAAIQYGSNFFPALYEKQGTGRALTPIGYACATLLMLMLVYINNRGVKFMSETNKYFSIWKIIVPVIAIVALILKAPDGFGNLTQSAVGGFLPFGWQGILSGLATAGVIFSFNGFQMGILMAAETKNPSRTIPISIIGSILFCFVLYSLLQLAFLVAVPQSTLLTFGWDKLKFVGDAGPFAGITLLLGLVWVSSLLYIDAVISPLGAGLVYTATTSRVLYAFGANGYLPPIVSKLNHKGIPNISVWINFVVGMLMFLPFPGWQSMVAFLSSTMIASYMAIPICLVALRKHYPHRPRPFRLPFYKLMSFLAFYICNLMLFWTGWTVIYKLLICIAVGTTIYFSNLLWKRNFLAISEQMLNGTWIFIYFIGFGILSKLGSYDGGNGLLPLGYDFFVIALFSGFVLWISQKFTLSDEKCESNINEILAFSKASLP